MLLDLDAPPSERAVSRRLRRLGLLRSEGKASKGKDKRRAGAASGAAAAAGSVSAALLRDLFGEFKDHPDALNQASGARRHVPLRSIGISQSDQYRDLGAELHPFFPSLFNLSCTRHLGMYESENPNPEIPPHSRFPVRPLR